MVSSGSSSTPIRNSIRGASQDSPRGIMDFFDGKVDAHLRGASRAFISSSTTAPESIPSNHLHPPIIRLKPRHDHSSSLWSVNPNASQLPRNQATNDTPPTLSSSQTEYVSSHFTSQRLLELRAGEIPNSLLIPFDF